MGGGAFKVEKHQTWSYKGYSLSEINAFLGDKDIAAWVHFGHGGESPIGNFTGNVLLKDNIYPGDGHSPSEFAPHHKLASFAFGVCGAGKKASEWVAQLLSGSGKGWMTDSSYNYIGNPFVTVPPGLNSYP